MPLCKDQLLIHINVTDVSLPHLLAMCFQACNLTEFFPPITISLSSISDKHSTFFYSFSSASFYQENTLQLCANFIIVIVFNSSKRNFITISDSCFVLSEKVTQEIHEKFTKVTNSCTGTQQVQKYFKNCNCNYTWRFYRSILHMQWTHHHIFLKSNLYHFS